MSKQIPKHQQTRKLLGELTVTLQQQAMWQSTRPAAIKLASTEPFCCDTLRFEQWLQFVFIPTMEHLLETQQPLPQHMSLVPMAEQVWPVHLHCSDLMQVLRAWDRLYQKAG
ncbi:YqcC family protein [Lacimicrobium sp. SS2-24]|uniref:YqcC family protein n=1 Tax=Lacimicrobium sp. SS2-24 TaxID=2005569 RepID=UPI0014396C7A|nr:YqcC family protein [Lacimicrobium sp. SS2-24]